MQRDDGSLWLEQRHDRAIERYHHAQGSTNDCGPHSAAAALGFCTGTPVDPAVLTHEMNRPRVQMGIPPLVVRRIPGWATLPWGIADVLRVHGLNASWRMRASEDDLHRALREERIPLPIFGEPFRRHGLRWTGWSHVAVVAGWSPTEGAYWFVDSARADPLSARAQDQFLRLWNNMGSLLVEVEA
ncbi:hypothetical protein [Aggregatilinea lenta]|uniref:hypothetical protein n=1 Tax=Aggregatilinea lenta TaxID=913108 RepID=UPI000E5C123B|nr:hypothetical protein [Aggregatilinea lenta]